MRKTTKILAIGVAFALIGGILLVGNAFVGNPISKMLATNTAKKHIEQNYGETDFTISEVNYNFKTGGYYARVESPSSMDSHFSITLSGTGKFQWDSYEDSVLNGRNTLERIDEEYRKLVEGVFDGSEFPYDSEISYGTMQDKYSEEVDSIHKNYGVEPSQLERDKVYDVRELGAKHGEITFYAEDEEVSIQRAGEILLHMTKILDEKNVPFYAINFVLHKPRTPDGIAKGDSRQINLTDFLYSDIYEEGLEERVQKSCEETDAYFAKMDAEKN